MGPGTVLLNDFGTTEFLLTGAETGGALHRQRVTYRPKSPFPQAHAHPTQEERFEVEEGAMMFVVDGDEHLIGVGGAITIPAGSVHRARNASEEAPAIVLWDTRPALRTAEFFVVANRIGADVLGRVLLVAEYRDVFRLPPPTSVLVPPLARLAFLMGKRLPEV
jgi:mannose-6-phosphate isomerase-like protein (cupin superfamily)